MAESSAAVVEASYSSCSAFGQLSRSSWSVHSSRTHDPPMLMDRSQRKNISGLSSHVRRTLRARSDHRTALHPPTLTSSEPCLWILHSGQANSCDHANLCSSCRSTGLQQIHAATVRHDTRQGHSWRVGGQCPHSVLNIGRSEDIYLINADLSLAACWTLGRAHWGGHLQVCVVRWGLPRSVLHKVV